MASVSTRYAAEQPGTGAQESDTVCLPQQEYQDLLNIARRYDNLRRNLQRGGVGDDAIELLSNDDPVNGAGPVESASPMYDAQALSSPNTSLAGQRNIEPKPASPSQQPQRRVALQTKTTWADREDHKKDYGDPLLSPPSSPAENRTEVNGSTGASWGASKASNFARPLLRTAKRSIFIWNLHRSTTLADVLGAIRGGQVLEVTMRHRPRGAFVSFVHEEDARAFHDHVLENKLCIGGKLVDVAWAEHHFALTSNNIHRIRTGATRNLVIRYCPPGCNEETIRQDLEHIHNLVVIAVKFENAAWYIQTNSIPLAIVAQTCMASRLCYKGCRFSFVADECAEPLPEVLKQKRLAASPVSRPLNPLANRFQVLDTDTEDWDDDDDY